MHEEEFEDLLNRIHATTRKIGAQTRDLRAALDRARAIERQIDLELHGIIVTYRETLSIIEDHFRSTVPVDEQK